MKKRKIISCILIAVLGVASTVSAYPYNKQQVETKHKELITNLEVYMNGIEAQENTSISKYSTLVVFKDRFNNLLRMQSKWIGSGFARQFDFNDSIDYKQTVQREGYKDLTIKVNLKEGARQVQDAILEPATIRNTVFGTVAIPESLKEQEIYIELTDSKDTVSAYLKVQNDGSFKCYNIPDDKYRLQVVTITPIGPNMASNKVFYREDVVIKGNCKKDIIIDDEAEITKLRPAVPSDFFNEVDYEAMKSFVKTNPNLQFSEKAATDIRTKIKKGSSDIKTIENIIKYIVKNYHSEKKPGYPNGVYVVTADELYTRGYCHGCSEFADLFEALCILFDIKTVQVHTISSIGAKKRQDKTTDMVGGHMFIETYVEDQDKWVLVDPTGGFLTTTYDPSNPTIKSSASPFQNDYLYAVRKYENGTPYYIGEGGKVCWSDRTVLTHLMDQFDLTLVNYDVYNESTPKNRVK